MYLYSEHPVFIISYFLSEPDGKKKSKGRSRLSTNPYDGMLVSQLLAQRDKLLKASKLSSITRTQLQGNVPRTLLDAQLSTVQKNLCSKTSPQTVISTVSASSTVQVSVSNAYVQPIPSSGSCQNEIKLPSVLLTQSSLGSQSCISESQNTTAIRIPEHLQQQQVCLATLPSSQPTNHTVHHHNVQSEYQSKSTSTRVISRHDCKAENRLGTRYGRFSPCPNVDVREIPNTTVHAQSWKRGASASASSCPHCFHGQAIHHEINASSSNELMKELPNDFAGSATSSVHLTRLCNEGSPLKSVDELSMPSKSSQFPLAKATNIYAAETNGVCSSDMQKSFPAYNTNCDTSLKTVNHSSYFTNNANLACSGGRSSTHNSSACSEVTPSASTKISFGNACGCHSENKVIVPGQTGPSTSCEEVSVSSVGSATSSRGYFDTTTISCHSTRDYQVLAEPAVISSNMNVPERENRASHISAVLSNQCKEVMVNTYPVGNNSLCPPECGILNLQGNDANVVRPRQMPPMSASNVTIMNSSVPQVLPSVGISQQVIANPATHPSAILQVVNMYAVDTVQGPMIVQNSIGNPAMSNSINGPFVANTFQQNLCPQGVQSLSPNSICLGSNNAVSNDQSHIVNRTSNCNFNLPNQPSAKYWVNNVNNTTITYAPAENAPILLSPNNQVVPQHPVNNVIQNHQTVYHNQGMTQVLTGSATSHISAYNAQNCVTMIPRSIPTSQLIVPNQVQNSYSVLQGPISPLTALQKPLLLNQVQQNPQTVFVNAQPSPNALPHGQSVMQAVTIVPARLPPVPPQPMITYQPQQIIAPGPVQPHLMNQHNQFPTEPFHNPGFSVVQPQASLAVFSSHGEGITLPVHQKVISDSSSMAVIRDSVPTAEQISDPSITVHGNQFSYIQSVDPNNDIVSIAEEHTFTNDSHLDSRTDKDVDPDSTTFLGDEAEGSSRHFESPRNPDPINFENTDLKATDDANNFKVDKSVSNELVATSSDACNCDERSALEDCEVDIEVSLQSTVSSCDGGNLSINPLDNSCSIVFTDGNQDTAIEEDKVTSDTIISESSSDGGSSEGTDEEDSSQTCSPNTAEMFYPSVIELAKSMSPFESIICIGAEQTCGTDDKNDSHNSSCEETVQDSGSSPSTSKESSDSGVESGQEPPLISSDQIDSAQVCHAMADPDDNSDMDMNIQGIKRRGVKRRRRELLLLQRSAESSSPSQNSEG